MGKKSHSKTKPNYFKKVGFATAALLSLGSSLASDVTVGAVSPTYTYNGMDYYTFADVTKAEADLQVLYDACNGDPECEGEVYISHRGEIYDILEQIRWLYLTVTSVDPAENTIEYYYRDNPPNGTPREDYDAVYMAWFDGTANPTHYKGNYTYLATPGDELTRVFEEAPYYVLQYEQGIMEPGMHLLVADTTKNSGEWLPDQEFITRETITPLSENPTGKFWYYVHQADGSSRTGEIDYTPCLTSYRPGMTCDIMFTIEDRWGTYLAVGEANPVEPTTDVVAPNTTEPEVIVRTATRTVYVPVATGSNSNGNSSADSVDSGEKSESEDSADSEKSAKSSQNDQDNDENAQIPTAANCHEGTVINFPWWFLALLAAGDALVLWWFLPRKGNKALK